MTRILSRSFENNWNIYKLLAHQKPPKEKVRQGVAPTEGGTGCVILQPLHTGPCGWACLPLPSVLLGAELGAGRVGSTSA